MRIIVGLLITAVGFCIVRFSRQLLAAFGRVGWFDDKLQTEGGSSLFYQLVGVVLVIIGFLYMTGVVQAFLRVMVSPLFRSV